MSTTLTLNALGANMVTASNPTRNTYLPYSGDTMYGPVDDNAYQLCKYNAPSGTNLYKRITAAMLALSVSQSKLGGQTLSVYKNEEDYDTGTVTYNTVPERGAVLGSYKLPSSGSSTSFSVSLAASGMPIKNGVTIKTGTASTSTKYVLAACNKSTLTLTLADETVGLSATGAPSSGYLPKDEASVLSWSTSPNGVCWGEVEQTAAAVEWYDIGSPGTVHTVDAGNSGSVTIPANTFTGAGIMWRAKITANSGAVTYSPWYEISTAEAAGTATAVSPGNETIDGSAPVTFSWRYQIETGTAQTAAELQRSADGVNWTSLASITGPATSWTAPAGTFSSGAYYWRVRAANTDGVMSEWSESLYFIAISQPAAPSVTATNEARTTVTWTAVEQEAYKVTIGGRDYGPFYGTERSFTPGYYLADGSYLVSVRVQNVYGLWSEPGEWYITVANPAAPEITLTATENGTSVALDFGGAAYDYFEVLRDGERIASTVENTFTDRYAPGGAHEYRVRGCYEGSGDYGLSARVSAETVISGVTLTDIGSGTEIDCPYTLDARALIAVTTTRSVSFTHYAGTALPAAERSETRTRKVSFAPAWPENMLAEAEAFGELLGKEVCYRDLRGRRIFGVIDAMPLESAGKSFRYSVTVTETDTTEASLYA